MMKKLVVFLLVLLFMLIMAASVSATYFINYTSGVEYNEAPDSISAVEYKEMKGQITSMLDSFKLLEPLYYPML